MTTASPSLSARLATPLRLPGLKRAFKRLGSGWRPLRGRPVDLPEIPTDPSGTTSAAAETASKSAAEKPQIYWGAWRIDLMERLWGEGFLLPGGTEFVTELTKPLNLNPKASVLILGAGMGGPANLIAQEFGAFIDAVEPDPELAAASAKRAAVVKGMSRVTISNQAIDDDDAFARKYDAIFGQEILLQVADAPLLLKRAAQALKENGKLVITDFSGGDRPDDVAVDAWLTREGASSPLRSETQLRAVFTEAGFRMRTVEDVTDRYVGLVLDGWAAFEESLRANAANRETLLGMIEEAERWALRVALLKDDRIRYTRLFATKKTEL